MRILQILIANSRIRIASVLGLIWLVYLIFNFDLRALILPLLSVFLVSFFDLLVTYLRKGRLYFPASSFVTGFLIGLIFSATEPVWVFILAPAMAVLSKQFIRAGEHRHIFNPAALGIVGASLLTGAPVSWWAVSWSPWVILIIVGVSYTLYQLKRLWLPIAFILLYSIYLFVTVGDSTFVSLVLDGTLFLFAFVMLPEPITSPAMGKWKYLFGPLVAVFVGGLGLLGRLGIVLPDVFLPALLLANLIGFLAKRLKI